MQVAWVANVTEGLLLKCHISTCGPCPNGFAPLCLGAAGVCRAALSEALLPALLQCVQGPCDHYLWGELIDSYSSSCDSLQGWDGVSSGLPLTLTGGKTVTTVPQVHFLSPQHTFCRRCALKSGRSVPPIQI